MPTRRDNENRGRRINGITRDGLIERLATGEIPPPSTPGITGETFNLSFMPEWFNTPDPIVSEETVPEVDPEFEVLLPRDEGIESQITNIELLRTYTGLTEQDIRDFSVSLATPSHPRTLSIDDTSESTIMAYDRFLENMNLRRNTPRNLMYTDPDDFRVNIKTPYDEIEMKEYKQDTEVKLRNGNTALYKDCVIAHDCFYLATDPQIVKDYYKPDIYIDKGKCSYLKVNFNKDGTINQRKYDYYYVVDRGSASINTVVEINDGLDHCMTDVNAIPKEFYVECIESNVWFHKSVSKKAVTQKKLKIRARKANCTYKPSYNKCNLKKDYEMGVVSPTFVKTEGKRYLYGLELETISGTLPKYVDDYLNYLSIKDGSLRDEDGGDYGYEYVTGVLTGDTGLLQLKKLSNELTKRCIVNKQCGIHVHLGGTDFTSETVVFLYKLSLMLEDQIFNMVPLSRRQNEYCKRLKPFQFTFNIEDFNNPGEYKAKIEIYYNNIYKFVSHTGQLPSSKANKKTQHPLGPKCGYNHSTARYCWMNFVPTIFDTRENGKNTVENRIMQGSTNFNKIKNWLLINMGILWYAENHQKDIALNNEISLKYIMELAYPKTFMDLNEYIDNRTNKFSSQDVTTNRNMENIDYQEVIESEDLTIKNL